MRLSPDIEPIGHVSPYRRIDPMHPSRKAVITVSEVFESGGREPDAAIYRYDDYSQAWYLKDGV